MLRRLSVENYALIDKLEMELGPHLNIITGETGAGKSILLGALGLLLGAKNDGQAMKDATRNCTVEGTFDLAGSSLEAFFAENDLDYAPETTLTRMITPAGKSRAFVNDVPVQLAQLRELGARLLAERQVLCILNSRRHARALFERCGKNEDLFHLSAYMTPCHRSRTLQTIRERLASGLPCRVISTSLIECGVDISFPVVYRERNGLDVIAQAAGRCNRHGERELGQVCVFDGEQPIPLRAADLNRRREACALVQDADDLFGPATIRRYFQALYSHPELLDEHAILRKMKLVTSSNAALDPRFYRIPKLDADFAEIDRTFQFIESQTDSVVIESQLPEELRTCLRNEQALPSRVFRRLQSYSVQVYRWEREAMEQAGRLECLHDCVYLLSGGLGYAEDTGLDVRMADGISSADLVF